MSKAGPHRRKKTLDSVLYHTKLPRTTKTCIKTVFERYDKLVYCKNCIHRYSSNCPMYLLIVEGLWSDTRDNDFCSYGERGKQNVNQT